MKMTGAKAVIESLKKEGVDTIFGVPGGAVIAIFDALYDTKEIRFVLNRHEQCATHAADGYARATGKVGVCIATSGPGATNLVTGIANAHMDSVPIVAFTGQVNTGVIGTDAFQEADITGSTLPCVKHSYLVTDPKEIPVVIKEAFHLASTGRPGPVLIDVPKDVTIAEIDFKYPKALDLPGYRPTYKGHPGQIKQAVDKVFKANRPVIYCGGGVVASNATKELKALAELLKAPVTTTLMAMGAFPETHKLFIGMPGMHGTAYANYALTDTDLIIAVGTRFDDRVTGKLDEFAPEATIIHIDIDPAEISKNVPAHVPVVGDAKVVLKDLIAQIKKVKTKKKLPSTKTWLEQINGWKKKHPLYYKQNGLKPQYIVEEIDKATNGEAIITTGVGQNQMWAAQFYKCRKPRRFISSGGLGTMGFGLPSAIGAQLGAPDKVVFDIDGDGSFQMVSQELATAVIYKAPINVVILNNGYLGMVRQWQSLFFKKRYSGTDLTGSPDFVKLAEAYGALGIRVTKPKDVAPAIRRAIKSPKPVLLDFKVAREEDVYPMVPAGAPIDQMLGGGLR